MCKQFASFVLLTLLLPQWAFAARIFAFITSPSYSHQTFLQPLWRELALRGHNVVLVTTHPSPKSVARLKQINIQNSCQEFQHKNSSFAKLIMRNYYKDWETPLLMINCQLAIPQVRSFIRSRNEHFDMVIVEDVNHVAFAFKRRFKCPLIAVTSMDAFYDMHSRMGNAVHSLKYPMPVGAAHDRFTFFGRLTLANNVMRFSIMNRVYFAASEEIARRHFAMELRIDELLNGADALITNANPIIMPTRPVARNTVNLAGGLHIQEPKSLPKDIQEFMDNAGIGVIYFSLGSTNKSEELTSKELQTMVNTFQAAPYKVLWKFDGLPPSDLPPNVKVVPWVPQQDVLRHEKTRLFITQGGFQSIEEALYFHVPMIIIPIHHDQIAHSQTLHKANLSITIQRYQLNTADFLGSIFTVIEDKQYKENVVQVGMQMKDMPIKPLQKAIWLMEYVLRHKGAQHLKGPIVPALQYYYLDVYGILAYQFIILPLVVVRTLVQMWRGGGLENVGVR